MANKRDEVCHAATSAIAMLGPPRRGRESRRLAKAESWGE
jgi:hypothetical protein